jgi:predicted metal-dependent peptidase
MENKIFLSKMYNTKKKMTDLIGYVEFRSSFHNTYPKRMKREVREWKNAEVS